MSASYVEFTLEVQQELFNLGYAEVDINYLNGPNVTLSLAKPGSLARTCGVFFLAGTSSAILYVSSPDSAHKLGKDVEYSSAHHLAQLINSELDPPDLPDFRKFTGLA